MAKSPAASTPKWILIATGIVGIVSALFVAVAKFHDIRKSRADAERARVEAETAKAEADRARAEAKRPRQQESEPRTPTPSKPVEQTPPAEPELRKPINPTLPPVERLPAQEAVRDFRADPPFDKYLKANPLLLELSGVKVIRLKDGGKVVVAVASTEIADDSASERIRAEKVCRIKCDAALLKDKQGVFVTHVASLDDPALASSGGETSQRTLAEVLEVTTAKIEGLVKVMPPVGRWKSGDGKVYFLATGVCLDNKGQAAGATPQ